MKQGSRTDWEPYMKAFNQPSPEALCRWALKKCRGYEKAATLLSTVKPISSKPIRNILGQKQDFSIYKSVSRLQFNRDQAPKHWPYRCQFCGCKCPYPRKYTCCDAHMERLVKLQGQLPESDYELHL